MINQSTNLRLVPSLADSNLVISALRCLETQLRHNGELLKSSKEVCAYLQMHLAEEKNEVFSALFLDNANRLLAFEKLFHGTINEAKVYPRRIVQKAIEYNAAAILLAHNHPSGECNPSSSDKQVTQVLSTILKIIDVRLLDHIIVSCTDSYSFAEHGLL
jgi:DNA repair protein RadC